MMNSKALPVRHARRPTSYNGRLLTAVLIAWGAASPMLAAQTVSTALMSREDLTAAAARADQVGDHVAGAAIRGRLRDGDFEVGDRIVLSFVSDVAHTDTLLVRAGRVIDVPGRTGLPLTGVLRSELRSRVTAELLQYVKAQEIDVAPLTRIGVLGEVSRPGYFVVRPDVPITDAIMLAGGPTPAADIENSFVKRGAAQLRSKEETRRAVARGLTLDQFGLLAGDELIVGRHRQLLNPATTAALGILATFATVFVTLGRH